MKSRVLSAVSEALKAMGVADPPDIEVEVPREGTHGDVATPVAMALARVLRRKPADIAKDIVQAIPESRDFKAMEVAGPGFINFTFSNEFVWSHLKELIRNKEKFLRRNVGQGQKILIEFVSANPTGPLHLGHGRGAAVGAALSNLLEAAGYRVTREYYVNDAGAQVRLLGESVFARFKQQQGIEYPFPEDGYQGDYIALAAENLPKDAALKYRDSTFEEAREFFIDTSLTMMLAGIKQDLLDFGVHFDTWQSERDLHSSGDVQAAIDYLKEKGHAYEDGGALWFKATEFGDEKDRVMIKSDGTHTYFASDIAYHLHKLRQGHEELINIWGADHHGYVPRLGAVMEALGSTREKLKVVLVQMVSLLRGGQAVQMSKRTGEFVTLSEVSQEVGADTAKFIFLTRRPDSQLEFDIETAKAANAENPVFYVQYANARINSLFKHAGEKDHGEADSTTEANLALLKQDEEIALIKKLLLYPGMFEGAALAREPHRVTYYLQELARLFHFYYNKHRVVQEGDPALSTARLALCGAVRVVLIEGLSILGVTAPDRM